MEKPVKRRKLSPGSEKEESSPSSKKDQVASKSPAARSDTVTSEEVEATKESTPYKSPLPPLPNEPLPSTSAASSKSEPSTSAPPLPSEAIPSTAPAEDDGWEPAWDMNAQAYYFYNRFTQVSQWENPRVPDANTESSPPTNIVAASAKVTSIRPAAEGGYNPAIHGDYDPNADYALGDNKDDDVVVSMQQANNGGLGKGNETDYNATAQFNRFTGRFQAVGVTPELHSDEAKAGRQMNAFFDVDAQANSHDGRSLKAERQGRKLTKSELKAFRERNKERKEEKKRAWLRD